MPNSQFEVLKAIMKENDPTLYETKVDDEEILVSRKKCEELYDVFEDIEFMLHHTLIRIKPRGYLYSYNN
jgi:hypothetical protein